MAGGLGGFALELDQPFGRGVRLGGLQPGQVISERRIPAAAPPQRGPGARVGLPVDRVVGLALDELAGVEAEGPGSGPPPRAGRFPGLGRVDVVAASKGRPNASRFTLRNLPDGTIGEAINI